MDNYYSSYINEIQSSQSTRKSSIIANSTNKKELNIKNKNFANNKINTSKNLSNYINANKKSLSLTNFFNNEGNNRYNNEESARKIKITNKRKLDAELLIKNIANNTISTEIESKNIFVSFNPNELNENEKETMKMYLKEDENLEIKKIFNDLYNKENIIKKYQNEILNYTSNYKHETKYNELLLNYNKEKEINLKNQRLINQKDNEIKKMTEINKKLEKEKNYLIEQLIKITLENKLLLTKNQNKTNIFNKNLNIIKEDIKNFPII